MPSLTLLQVFESVLPVFILAGVGVILRKVEWLTQEADESLIRVVVNVLTPCLIFDRVLNNDALKRPENLLVPPVMGFLGIAVGIGLCWVFRRRIGLKSDAEQRTFALVAGLQNYGYVPFPLILQLFPEETTGVLFVHNLGVDIAMWSLGLITLGHVGGFKAWRRLLNAPILSILTALALNGVRAQEVMPHSLLTSISMLGKCAFPLGLVLSGATMADQSREFRSSQTIRVVAWASLLRLGLIPVVLLAMAKWLPVSIELRRVLAIEAAMPAAVFPVVMARQYGGHPATAVRIVIGTSFVGLVTIPLWIRAAIGWLGLS
ncbi:MAG TPA: AEC family transporter [Candidatus Limnocylindria bacterium]|nr:AEC family transporter [Candidatus Limnocylindria bacterium]